MTTRQTSIDVYREIEAEGLLSKRRWEAYSTLFNHGPITAMETARKIPGTLDHSISPRFAELKRMGLIREVGERACRITGRNCIIWDVTNNLPIKFEKPKRIKCSHCKGKGYFEEVQGKLF